MDRFNADESLDGWKLGQYQEWLCVFESRKIAYKNIQESFESVLYTRERAKQNPTIMVDVARQEQSADM